MTDEAVIKTGSKPLIVEKLEKVRRLTKTIEGVGEIVGEVSRLILALDSNLIIIIASSGHQGSVESRGTAYRGKRRSKSYTVSTRLSAYDIGL